MGRTSRPSIVKQLKKDPERYRALLQQARINMQRPQQVAKVALKTKDFIRVSKPPKREERKHRRSFGRTLQGLRRECHATG